MESTSFVTPKNQIVVIVLNRDISSHKFTIHYPSRGYVENEIPAHAIQTYLFEA
jgi:hypothetical protein